MLQSTGYPSAWVVDSRDRGRKKIYSNNKVYLNNGQEFLIEFYNPTQKSVLAELKINGELASSSGLIIRPGQRFYLDCFVDDRRKFIFNTYEVENSSESKQAIAKNGFIEVKFYQEKAPRPIYNNPITINTVHWDASPYLGLYNINCSGSMDFTTSCFSADTTGSGMKDFQQKAKRSKTTLSASLEETGRVEKGAKSKQQFESVNMDFEYWCLNTISYQILPESKKPIEASELKKNFCFECGNKLRGTEKFCPSCGTRL